MKLKIRISQFRPIFGEPKGITFLALVSKTIFDLIEFIGPWEYDNVHALPTNANEIPEVIKSLEGLHHIFCITSDAPFNSPPTEYLRNIKLGVLPMFSTGFSFAKLEKAIQIAFQIDYNSQYIHAQQLIHEFREAEQIIFEDRKHRTSASLDLCSPWHKLFYFNQSGPIEWGQQSILPNGEVSILTNRHGEYSTKAKFALDGDITVYGYPILHRGNCPCANMRKAESTFNTQENSKPSWNQACPIRDLKYVSIEKQERIFRNLASMSTNATVLSVKNGFIESVKPLNGGNLFTTQLMEMIHSDVQYQKIHEIGFGLNICEGFFMADNFLPNELTYGVHFGLGLTPYTEFHLDLACPNISVNVSSETHYTTVIHKGGDT